MYERFLKSRLTGSTRSAMILGPRQVGKATLLAELRPDLCFDLASPKTFRQFVTRPELLKEILDAAPVETRSVLIDEIQKVPALLDVIQVVIDSQAQRFRFLLSGSSAHKLRRGHANLLPGRVVVHAMHPLLAHELGNDFNLDRALTEGTLPGLWSEPDAQTRAELLRSYVDIYLREEIQAEALVRDIGGYTRLLDFVAAASGTITSINALCSAAEIGHETARRYLDVLEDTLVMFRLPAWSGSDRSSLVAHPKLFLFDTGIRNALLRRPFNRLLPDDRGPLFEHFIIQELWRRCGSLWPEARPFHYRTKHGAEVDVVLDIGGELWGIEIKTARQISADQLRGLQSLGERTKQLKRKIIVCMAEYRSTLNDVEVWPWRLFLEQLPR